MICANCAGYSAAPVNLPDAPGWAVPVEKPLVTVGDDARLAYRKMDVARSESNSRLSKFRAWYLGVKKRYGAAKL